MYSGAIEGRLESAYSTSNSGLSLPAIARHLAGDGGARPLESGGYSRRTPTHHQLCLKQRSFFKRQMFIRFSHATFSLSEMLHLDFERGDRVPYCCATLIISLIQRIWQIRPANTKRRSR